MELKDLDLLSEKVAKALYMIKNLKAENQGLKAENESLNQRLNTLSEENAYYVEQVEDKESNIKLAAERLEGMLESLKALDSEDLEPVEATIAEIEELEVVDQVEEAEEHNEFSEEDSADEEEVVQESFLASSEDDANPLLDFIVESSESKDELPY